MHEIIIIDKDIIVAIGMGILTLPFIQILYQ